MSRLRPILAMAGFGVALLAVATEDGRIGWVAIILLAASLLLRLVQRKRSGEHREDESDSTS